MDTIKINKESAKLIAHRGLSGIEQENTNAAFIAAGNRSYFGIETDVHITSDGKFVVIHDDTPKRVSGVDFVVEENPLRAIENISIYDKAEGVFRSDLRPPLLHEYINICKKYEKTSVLELKRLMPVDGVKNIYEEVKSLGYLENTIFISFAWGNLEVLKKIDASVSVQFLTNEWNDELIDKLKEYNMDLDIHYSAVNDELIGKLHKNGLKLNAWTVDNKETAEKLASMGIDYITSNILE